MKSELPKTAQRVAFEEYLGFSPMVMSNGDYADPDISQDWKIWQAAMQSPVIQALSAALEATLSQCLAWQGEPNEYSCEIHASVIKQARAAQAQLLGVGPGT